MIYWRAFHRSELCTLTPHSTGPHGDDSLKGLTVPFFFSCAKFYIHRVLFNFNWRSICWNTYYMLHFVLGRRGHAHKSRRLILWTEMRQTHDTVKLKVKWLQVSENIRTETSRRAKLQRRVSLVWSERQTASSHIRVETGHLMPLLVLPRAFDTERIYKIMLHPCLKIFHGSS